MIEQGTLIEELKIKSKWNVGPIEKDKYYSWEDLFDLYEVLYGEYEASLEKIEKQENDIEYLKEAYERLEEDIRENYRPIPVMEQVGMSERDFI